MNELAKHIEYLLLYNDIVIVPHFGAFVSKFEQARFVDSEEIYLPSISVVRFNPDLIVDNSYQFVDSLVEIYGYTREEADAKCAEVANEINAQLAAEGSVDLGSIGVLSLTDGAVTLSPCEAGITSPSLYGLDSFTLRNLQSSRTVVAPDTSERKDIVKDDKNIVIRLNRRFVNATITIAASIMMFLLFSTTAENTNRPNGKELYSADLFVPSYIPKVQNNDVETSSLNTNQILPQIKNNENPSNIDSACSKSNVLDDNSIETCSSLCASSATSQVESSVATSTDTKIDAGKYSIVLACKVSKKNAQHYVQRMQGKVNNCCITMKQGHSYVVIQGFDTQAAAISKKNELIASGVINSGWVMKN